MIEVNKIVKYYGDKRAVSNVSFSVNSSEILGFLGPNGAGKSTVMNILTGYLASSSGKVLIDGVDIFEDPISCQKKMGYLPEHPPLYLDMTVMEYLLFISELKCVPKNKRMKHINDIMSAVKVLDVSKRIIGNLSKGYRQRIGIAQALVGNPPIIVLDEPTIGLDPKQMIEIRTLIKSLKKNHTVIISTHILSEVQFICDRVLIINKGKIIAQDTPLSLSNSLMGPRRLAIKISSTDEDVLLALESLAKVQHARLSRVDEDSQLFDIIPVKDQDPRNDIFFLMAKNKWPIIELRSPEPTMEDIYLKLIN